MGQYGQQMFGHGGHHSEHGHGGHQINDKQAMREAMKFAKNKLLLVRNQFFPSPLKYP